MQAGCRTSLPHSCGKHGYLFGIRTESAVLADHRCARRERAEGPGREGVRSERADQACRARFFAPSRRRRPRQRRREGAEPPSGGRVDPVAAGLSRRAWPGPARVERAGHGCAARRKRPPREGSRDRALGRHDAGVGRSVIGRVPTPSCGRRCRRHEDAGSVVDSDSAVRLSRCRPESGRVRSYRAMTRPYCSSREIRLGGLPHPAGQRRGSRARAVPRSGGDRPRRWG